MARVAWFQEHPERHMHQSGTTEIWCKDIFEPLGQPPLFLYKGFRENLLELSKSGKEKMFSLFCHLKGKCTCENILKFWVRHSLKGSVAYMYLVFMNLFWL